MYVSAGYAHPVVIPGSISVRDCDELKSEDGLTNAVAIFIRAYSRISSNGRN
jgi:hypothetical protein